ncbi:hypothetical protein D3C73_1664970 [compost metagenome]
MTRGGQEFLRENAVGRVHVAILLGLEDGVARAQIVAAGFADAIPQFFLFVGFDQRFDLLL